MTQRVVETEIIIVRFADQVVRIRRIPYWGNTARIYYWVERLDSDGEWRPLHPDDWARTEGIYQWAEVTP